MRHREGEVSGAHLFIPARRLVDQVAEVFEVPVFNSLEHFSFTSLRGDEREERGEGDRFRSHSLYFASS
jgi:hypothetical protein